MLLSIAGEIQALFPCAILVDDILETVFPNRQLLF